MIKVSNRKCIRNLGMKCMHASRTRNIVAVSAIILTTILFTTLFTIAQSFNTALQESNFRSVGGYNHGTFKNLTLEQAEELQDDPLIQAYGMRHYVGMASGALFNKDHVEISFCDENEAKWGYRTPTKGQLPQEGTDEAATDTQVLSLLGVEPKLGKEITITFDVDGVETTQTFTLCGWWEHDDACEASHVLIPESRAEEIFHALNTQGNDGMTSFWSMSVMFSNSMNIADNMIQVLSNHGYQSEGKQDGSDNYIHIGVNWGYMGAQLSNKMGASSLVVVIPILLLIIFTGYLIIYNIFQISVVADIRFYGLLKTIGTTPKQIKSVIRQQAVLLCTGGIPFGLILGWLLGVKLTPVLLAQLNGMRENTFSANPVIFIFSTLFSVFTVFLSCRRPGRLASEVSPIEAVRYTESGVQKAKKTVVRKANGKNSPTSMAWANLGRNKKKTAVTVLSLSLAVVLLSLTVTFANGFDMKKYLKSFAVTDFVLADADYFQSRHKIFEAEMAVPEAVIDEVASKGDITEGGRVYGTTSIVNCYITEERYRIRYGEWNSPEEMDQQIANSVRDEYGLICDRTQISGMDPFILEQLTVFEGDISTLMQPDSHNIAAVYWTDDYDSIRPETNWAKIGDTVSIRYVDEYQCINPFTGEEVDQNSEEPFELNITKYRDVSYTVTAIVAVPNSLSYRYHEFDTFLLGSQTFIEDTGTNDVMLYAYNTTEESNDAMETFLADYTQKQNPQFDYESRSTHAIEFNEMRMMFLLLGTVISFIIALIGILNFFNAVLTGIITRKRELAMLQSIGMTGNQLKKMLLWEGLFYTMASVLVVLLLTTIGSPLVKTVLENMFWFFTYRFTALPIVLVTPIFALLGCFIPVLVYRHVAKQTIVERLREV